MYLVMEHLCSVGAILMALPEEANRQEIMHGGKEVTAMPTVRKGVASAQTETVCSVSGREQSETVREREREGKRVRACVAYSVSFFLASRIEMCVSGVGNEPQREEQRGGSRPLRTEQPYRTDDGGGGRKEKGARVLSPSLSLCGALLGVRPSVRRRERFPCSASPSLSPRCVGNNFFRECRRPSSLSLSLSRPPSPSICFPFREERGEWGLAPRERRTGGRGGGKKK